MEPRGRGRFGGSARDDDAREDAHYRKRREAYRADYDTHEHAHRVRRREQYRAEYDAHADARYTGKYPRARSPQRRREEYRAEYKSPSRTNREYDYEWRASSPPRRTRDPYNDRSDDWIENDGYAERAREQRREPSRPSRDDSRRLNASAPSLANALPRDWDCATCGAFNFARRTACFQCFTQDEADKKYRTDEAAHDKQPTPVLYIRNIPSDATEEELAKKVNTIIDKTLIRSIQMPIERESGRRKGYAFVDCTSIEHARTVKQHLDGTAFRQGDWTSGALSADFSTSKLSQKLAVPVSGAAQVAILQATAASSMTSNDHAESDYIFDNTTGYYRHKTTGILYDANTGLFFNASTNAWYSWNESTQEYIKVGSKKIDADVVAQKAEQTQRRPVAATISSAPKPATESYVLTKDETTVSDEVQYRDRARERRKLYGEDAAVDRLNRPSIKGRVTGGRIRKERK